MGTVRTLARGLALRCPHCGEGRIFARFFTAHDACPACERVFQRDPGDWTGGAEMTMLLSLPLGVLLLFGLKRWFSLPAWTEVTVVMVAVALALPLAYRHVKGFWLGILRAWEGPDPQPSPLQEPEWFVALWEREGR